MNTTTPHEAKQERTAPRTDLTLAAMQGGRYTADNTHPLYVLSAELEQQNAALDELANANVLARCDAQDRAEALETENARLLTRVEELEKALEGLLPYVESRCSVNWVAVNADEGARARATLAKK